MEGVNTSMRLPVIGSGFQSGVRNDREPVGSWSGIRTCVIDDPKDDEFSRRQEVWSYHNRNRGVVKSLLKKLPNVPFRIKRKKMKQKDIDMERDRIRETIARLPNISNTEQLIGRESPSRNPKTRPLGMSKYLDVNSRSRDKVKEESDTVDLTLKLDTDNNNNNRNTNHNGHDMQSKSEHLHRVNGRMSRTNTNKVNSKLGEHSKKVSYSMNDLSRDIDNRCMSASSGSSTVSDTAIENYGHSSYGVAELSARSVLDVFGNDSLGESRNLDTSKGKPSNSLFKISDNHKHWFQRVVGDKELIAFNDYENFARTSRPLNERASDDLSQMGKIPPEKQYSRSGWNVYSQSGFSNNQGSKLYNNTEVRSSRAPQAISSTKVGVRSIESRLNDQCYVRQNDMEKLKRFDKTFQTQTQTQNRISERLTQARSPERYNHSKFNDVTYTAQTQTPSRLADRLAPSRSPDRMLQGPIYNRNVPQRPSKLSSIEQQFNELGHGGSSNDSPSPTRFMGEYKLSKSPAPVSPGRYFPIFPTDGTPMRKIGGGGKNKLQKTNSRNQPIVLPLQETETYVMS